MLRLCCADDQLKLRDAAAKAAAAVSVQPPNSSSPPADPVFRRKFAEQQLHQATLLGDPGEYQRWLALLVTALCETQQMVCYSTCLSSICLGFGSVCVSKVGPRHWQRDVVKGSCFQSGIPSLSLLHVLHATGYLKQLGQQLLSWFAVTPRTEKSHFVSHMYQIPVSYLLESITYLSVCDSTGMSEGVGSGVAWSFEVDPHHDRSRLDPHSAGPGQEVAAGGSAGEDHCTKRPQAVTRGECRCILYFCCQVTSVAGAGEITA